MDPERRRDNVVGYGWGGAQKAGLLMSYRKGKYKQKMNV